MTFTELTEKKIWDMPKNMDRYFFQAPGTEEDPTNVKLGSGIYTWSTLISDRVWNFKGQNGENIQVKGTCKKCSGCASENEKGRIPCYVEKSIYGPHGGSVMKNHVKNTLGLRENIEKVLFDLDKFMTREEKKHGHGITVRLDQAGEVENEDQLFMWVELCVRHPESKLYAYTKNYEIFTENLLKGLIPENMFVLYSVWSDQGINEYKAVKHLKNVKAFVYVSKELTPEFYASHGLIIDAWCHAYGENGKMDHNIPCSKCGQCFNVRKNKVIGCWDHS